VYELGTDGKEAPIDDPCILTVPLKNFNEAWIIDLKAVDFESLDSFENS
jgi:hypothetical protein